MLELNNMQEQSTCVSLTVLLCFVSSYIKSVNVFPVKGCKYYQNTSHMPNIDAPSTMSIPALPSPHDMQFFLRRDRWKRFKLILPPVV